MLKRSTDAAFLNRVVNHPEIARWMCGLQPPFDLAPALAHPSTIFLANEYGGFLFLADGNEAYEVHTQFLPEGRGNTLELARQAAWYIFTQTEALAIRTHVPDGNVAARKLTERMGFALCGELWINDHRSDIYILNVKQWARSLCQSQFH